MPHCPLNAYDPLTRPIGLVTEDLNGRWYKTNSGQIITDIKRQIRIGSKVGSVR